MRLVVVALAALSLAAAVAPGRPTKPRREIPSPSGCGSTPRGSTATSRPGAA